MDVRHQAEHADHQGVTSPVRLERNAEIGRWRIELSGRREWIGTEALLNVEIECLVSRQLHVHRIANPQITAQAEYVCRISAFDDCARSRGGRESRSNIGIAPGRGRVP